MAVEFDAAAAAERVYEELRRKPIGSRLPPWNTLSDAAKQHFMLFADGVILFFVEQMNKSGLKAETHFPLSGQKS